MSQNEHPVTITIQKGGPVIVLGEIHITDQAGNEYPTTSYTSLCRCGKSEDLPFCDNTHIESGFDK